MIQATPPLTQQFAPREKLVLALGKGGGGWVVLQDHILISAIHINPSPPHPREDVLFKYPQYPSRNSNLL